MKKRWLFISMAILLQSSLLAGVIEKTYSFHSYKIAEKDSYQTISFSNTMLTGKTGEPVLPYRAVLLLLPSGEAVKSIEVKGENPVEITGQFRLYPRQPDRPLSVKGRGDFQINQAVYNQQGVYPESPAGTWSTQIMNGYAVAMTTITPVQYQPTSGKIVFFQNMKVIVHTESATRSAKALRNLSAAPGVRNRVENFVQNSEMLKSYAAKTHDADDYQVLIVTSSALESGYTSLIQHYLIRGLKSEVITTASIVGSASGIDLPEKIRNTIIQEYQDHSIEHVVLGGDVEHVPYRGFYCTVMSGGTPYVDSNIPSDLYYSALDGSWNDNGDGKWGEIGEDDLLPEVSVARHPVSDTAQLSNLISKITSYESSPVLGELDKPFLLGEKFWDNPLSWGADYLNLLIGHKEDNGYTTDGIPESHNYKTLYEKDHGVWSVTDLLSEINEGKSFIYHSGHANYFYNMKLHESDIIDANFALVDGVTHNFTLVNTHGCNSGGFEKSDCIAEQMVNLETFAVAFVGNSRYGWDNEGQTEGPSTHLQREFVDALYGSRNGRLGQAHLESRIDTAPWVNAADQWEEGALRWCFYCCNILGDPVMSVWTDEPINVQASFSYRNAIGSTSLNVAVDGEGGITEGLCCSLVKDGVLHGVGVVDAGGNAEIIIDSPFTETNIAELIVSGYNCLPQHHSVLFTDVEDHNPGIPTNTELIGNYPNPFNPETSIRYALSRSCHVEVAVFNLSGQRIRTLIQGRQDSGVHSAAWNGQDSNGRRVGSGIYVVRLQTDHLTDVRKMSLVK